MSSETSTINVEGINDRAGDLIGLTAEIVCAYVSNNSVPAAELPSLIASVHGALAGLSGGAVVEPAVAEIEKPTAGQIKKSVQPDGITSFLDGKTYKTMRRHLTTHGLDPHSYRAKFGLPNDYPMVCANYSEQRSALAKSLGLGQPGRALKAAA